MEERFRDLEEEFADFLPLSPDTTVLGYYMYI